MDTFTKFKIGTVFNPLSFSVSKLKPVCHKVTVKFPSRLNAMALDPSKITSNRNMIFTPGEIVFSIQIYKTITLKIIPQKGKIDISSSSQRKPLIKHAVLIMRKALNVNDGLYIDIDNSSELKHCGLGSSGSLIASVARGINALYGEPLSPQELVKYLAQNHGEEIEGENHFIQQVQCIGGSAASGCFSGGLLLITGKSQVIKTMVIPSDYTVIIGIPEGFKQQDAKLLMKKEEKKLPAFLKTGLRYGPIIAYRILHEVLPAMNEGNLNPIGKLIYDYRFKMGSIKNCSFTYPELNIIANKLRIIQEKKLADVLALSSVGPAFFAITMQPKKCKAIFKAAGLTIYQTKIDNKCCSIKKEA